MDTKNVLITGAIAGGVMALLSHIPIIAFGNCLICMWLWGGGIFAVWLYRRLDVSATKVEAGEGAILGVVSGVFGAVFGTILGTILGGAGIASLLASRAPVGEEILGSFAVAGVFSVLGFIFNIFIYPLFGAIGGAIGGTIIKGDSTNVIDV